ncbi:MAG: hypothetical protein WCA89_09895 [Terracidiphilus sp.]
MKYVALQGDGVSGPASIDKEKINRAPSRQTEESGANSQKSGLAGRQKSSEGPVGCRPKVLKLGKIKPNLAVFAYHFDPFYYA